jgi:hypothetical protein
MLYSKSTNGFYLQEVHGTDIPSDAVEITDDTYRSLLDGQSQGKTIAGDINGYPILLDKTLEQIIILIKSAIQSKLDTGARSWGYFDIVSGTSYVSSTNRQYAADAQALIAWRDSVWEWAIPLFSGIQGGEDIPTFLQNMPAQPAQPTV